MDSKEPNISTMTVKERERITAKRIIKIIVFALIAIVVLYGILLLVEQFTKKAPSTNEKETYNYSFYEPDFSEDIRKDSAYMELDRNFYYADVNMGTTESIDDASLSQYDKSIQFMYEIIGRIIAGDYQSFNAYLSPKYLAENKNEKYEPFTQQKLYNIQISKYNESDEGAVTFVVEYMIFKNNGTFRNDVGSDAIRKQFITVSSYAGNFMIDGIYYYHTN